ncbi:hypothetical protein L7F22_048780 [Adiantum nelumboides]|nr:hypothetical protein [Adiantum nelumboides]
MWQTQGVGQQGTIDASARCRCFLGKGGAAHEPASRGAQKPAPTPCSKLATASQGIICLREGVACLEAKVGSAAVSCRGGEEAGQAWCSKAYSGVKKPVKAANSKLPKPKAAAKAKPAAREEGCGSQAQEGSTRSC